MDLNEIVNRLEEDPRNAKYTARGVPPIMQINPWFYTEVVPDLQKKVNFILQQHPGPHS